jgi:hypothetical protein
MSKHMQLTVSVCPYYQKGIEETYRNLSRHLKYLDPELVNRNPSLYELTGQLDQLLYRFEGTPLREILLPHREKLIKLRRSVEESLANRDLSSADRSLYEIEDVFDDIESELAQ